MALTIVAAAIAINVPVQDEHMAGLLPSVTRLVFSLPRPARHHHVIHAMVKAGLSAPIGPSTYEQGFMMSDGRFCSREYAAKVAFESMQIRLHKDELFSEDLW